MRRSRAAVIVADVRAIGYVRVSSQGQAEHGMGLATQRDRVREFAAAKGMELIDVVQEAASGAVQAGEELSYAHRPVLLSIIERAERGEIDAIVVARFDRLSRDYPSLAVLERRLRKHGVRLHSAAEENGDGPVGEFIRGQLALVAQLERAMILERVSAGKAKRKAQGKHVHGRIPYGYRRAPGQRRGELSIDESQAEVVKLIFERARRGATAGAIARELNTAGVPSPGGTEWDKSTVRRLVANPAYYGERYGVRDAHPAIVTRRTWNAAQRPS